MENFFILKFKGFSDIFVHLSDSVLAKMKAINKTKNLSEKLDEIFFEKMKGSPDNECEYCHGESNLLLPCIHCICEQSEPISLSGKERDNFIEILNEADDFGEFFLKELKSFKTLSKEEDLIYGFPQMI